MSVPLASQLKERENLAHTSFLDSRSLDGFNIHVLDSATESQLINLGEIPMSSDMKKRKGGAGHNYISSLKVSDSRRQASLGTKSHVIRSIQDSANLSYIQADPSLEYVTTQASQEALRAKAEALAGNMMKK